MNAKEVAIVAVLSALVFVSQSITPLFLAPIIIIVGQTLKLKQAMLLGITIGGLTYFSTGQIIALSNIFLLPLLILLISRLKPLYVKPNCKEPETLCLSSGAITSVRYGIVAGVCVFFINVLAELIALAVFRYPVAVLIAGLLPAVIGAIISGVLVGTIGVYLQQRISKLIWKFERQ